MQSTVDYSFVPLKHVPFWTPVTLNTPNHLATNSIAKYALQLGNWADQYAYFDIHSMKLNIYPVQPQSYKVYFEGKAETTAAPSNKQTAIKIAGYVLTLFVVPTFALIVKTIYKVYLNCICSSKRRELNTIIAEKMIGKTRVMVLTGDLFAESTDAIVNAANTGLRAGAGVCGEVRRRAGASVFNECADILIKQNRTTISTGEAVLTTGGKMAPRIKTIVHATGPDCRDPFEKINKKQFLIDAYQNSLEILSQPDEMHSFISAQLTDQQSLRTIAFPALSAGIFGYFSNESAPVALQAIQDFIESNPDSLDEVRLVCRAQDNIAHYYKNALENLNTIEDVAAEIA